MLYNLNTQNFSFVTEVKVTQISLLVSCDCKSYLRQFNFFITIFQYANPLPFVQGNIMKLRTVRWQERYSGAGVKCISKNTDVLVFSIFHLLKFTRMANSCRSTLRNATTLVGNACDSQYNIVRTRQEPRAGISLQPKKLYELTYLQMNTFLN